MADFLNTILLLANLTGPLSIKDFGVQGQTFPIEEENLIDYIQDSIKSDSDDKRIQEHYSQSFKNPEPVCGLSEAKKSTIHYFDPTIIAKTDIKDEEGKIVIPRRTAYNPLEYFSLSQDLLFFDGDQAEHIQWAKSLGKESKWILVKGKPFELEEKENRPVFFDQGGLLVQKLSIKTIPARVTQEGRLLKIESMPIKESTCGS